MAKLFAMENEGVEEVIELEVSPEEGEVSDSSLEVVEQIAEVEEDAAAVTDGVDASEQMGDVEELLEKVNEEGEGLSPEAAEAVKIAVESIAARIGANPKSIYAVVATENFQSASARKANTAIALEGVGEFLKDLWKRIKAAMSSLWNKVKAFWAKHVSALGRVTKALEATKKKVKESTGQIKGQRYKESAPSGMASAFRVEDINVKSIGEIIARHAEATTKAQDQIAKQLEDFGTEVANGTDVTAKAFAAKVELGTEKAPCVYGKHAMFKVSAGKGKEGKFSVDVEFTKETADKAKSTAISIAEKGALIDLIGEVQAVIKATIDTKKKWDKTTSDLEKSASKIDAAIESGTDEEKKKAFRKTLPAFYKVQGKTAGVFSYMTGLNVQLAKAVIGYANICTGSYAAKK